MKGQNDMIVCDCCQDSSKPAYQMARLHASLVLDRAPNNKGQYSTLPIIMAGDLPRPDLCKECGQHLGDELLAVLKKYSSE